MVYDGTPKVFLKKKNQRYSDDIENWFFKMPNNDFPSLSTLMKILKIF